jgi:prepilin-type N-terminal cleavage/methylation domain-containing protein
MRQRFYRLAGFTLVELLVVITIISILATIGVASFGGSRAASRDALRQADLRNLQSAIEQYKQKNGLYPLGCNGSGQWSGGTYTCTPASAAYITGLVPEFITRLPVDPKITSTSPGGYAYRSDGVSYKLMAVNTVESEIITTAHPFKSCDDPAHGICSSGGACNPNPSANAANKEFLKSYAVWGGYGVNTAATNAIICQ